MMLWRDLVVSSQSSVVNLMILNPFAYSYRSRAYWHILRCDGGRLLAA